MSTHSQSLAADKRSTLKHKYSRSDYYPTKAVFPPPLTPYSLPEYIDVLNRTDPSQKLSFAPHYHLLYLSLRSKRQTASGVIVYRIYLGNLAPAVILLSGSDPARLVYDQSVFGAALYCKLHVGGTSLYDYICDCKKKGLSDLLFAPV